MAMFRVDAIRQKFYRPASKSILHRFCNSLTYISSQISRVSPPKIHPVHIGCALSICSRSISQVPYYRGRADTEVGNFRIFSFQIRVSDRQSPPEVERVLCPPGTYCFRVFCLFANCRRACAFPLDCPLSPRHNSDVWRTGEFRLRLRRRGHPLKPMLLTIR